MQIVIGFEKPRRTNIPMDQEFHIDESPNDVAILAVTVATDMMV